MGGATICPFFESGHKPKSINVFNRGIFANTAWFFNYELFTWWMPFEHKCEYDGTKYAMNPIPTALEV